MAINREWKIGIGFRDKSGKTLAAATGNQRGYDNLIKVKCQAIQNLVNLVMEMKVRDSELMTTCKSLVTMFAHKKKTSTSMKMKNQQYLHESEDNNNKNKIWREHQKNKKRKLLNKVEVMGGIRITTSKKRR